MSTQSEAKDWRAEKGNRATTCKHFNGLSRETCDMGHCYANVARPMTEEERAEAEQYADKGFPTRRYSIANRVPCFRRTGAQDQCDDYELPTREEIAEEDRRIARMIEETSVARSAIVKHIEATGQKKQFAKGAIDCPVCGNPGTLHFRYSGHYNGHIHARCSAAGCDVQWME